MIAVLKKCQKIKEKQEELLQVAREGDWIPTPVTTEFYYQGRLLHSIN
jgi:hypothetical protein